MVAPLVAGLAVLVILGVHPPGDLIDLLHRAAPELAGSAMSADAATERGDGRLALRDWRPDVVGSARGRAAVRRAVRQRPPRPAESRLPPWSPRRAGVDVLDAELRRRRGGLPVADPGVPAAFWYEREIHDLFGLVPLGHPRLDPLVLPLADTTRTRPGPVVPAARRGWIPTTASARHVAGPGLFTIPHGPVRSGVFESIEYLVETPGEDIPHLSIRPYYKHRGIAKRVRGHARRRRGAASPSGSRASPRSHTRWPTATRSSR